MAVAVAATGAGAGDAGIGQHARTNVLRGRPENRTTIGAALVDTSSEVTTGVGVSGTILAAVFTGNIATSQWSAHQTAQFQHAVTIAGLALTVVAAALVGWGYRRSRYATNSPATMPVHETIPA